MIDIKDISGSILKSVPITQECKSYNELMNLCYITLSWEEDSNTQLPAGAYIEYGGNTYRLLEPYDPTYVNKASWRYTPQFYDEIASWSKKPFFLVLDTGEETDWSLTAYPGQFMEAVVAAIQKYTGKTYTYSVDAAIAQLSMQNVTFQNENIFDGLTKIANAWNTEWWVSGNVIHLSKCQYGTEITLTVGDNIGIPNVTKNKDGYFTRFYAFGGTRNITQDYDDGGFTNGLVNKRLTLSPSEYPGGYIDIKPNLQQAEIFVKTIIFDDIYPSSSLTISGVRAELKDYINEDGSKIQIGEDAEGNPLYQQYAIWYFKIPNFTFNNSTYDKEDNPDGMLLPGLALSVSFESGQLNGRNFELIYHEDTAEYEIKFVTEGTLIVPGTVSLIPADGDAIILYNIKMPAEYTSSAQDDLAEALLSEIDKYKQDRNSYTFSSASDKFEEGNLDMNVGQSVTFVRGSQSLSTRVLKVEKQIDYPIEQTITVGEEKIKGNTQEIKEEVIDANQNIDVVKALADLNKAITDGYGRVQQLIMQSLSQYKGIWTLDQNGFPNDPSKWTIKTDYTAISAKDFIAFADGGEYASGLPVADFDTFGLFKAKKNGGLLFDANEGWYVDPEFAAGGGIDEEQLKQYLTDNNYITVDYLTKQGYLTLSSQLTGYTKPEAYSPITATDTILSAIGKLERNFDNYVDLTTNQTIGGVKTFNETLLSKKDVIAYADGGEYASGLPVADTVTYGLVKVDGTTVRINASGQLEADAGGGIDFTVGTGLDLSAASVLSVKFGTTSGTVCQGNDSRLSDARRNPYSLSWSGFSSGSYDGSSPKSLTIPSNTSQLTNGAGFIYDADENIFSLVGSGNPSQYLAGNGRFYTVSFNELSGIPSWITGWNTNRFNLNSNGGAVFKSTGTMVTPSHTDSPISSLGVEIYNNQIRGINSSNVGNLYLNYIDSVNYVKIDPGCNIISTRDIIAYADGGSYASGLPVADSYTYGLIKYDGTTIGKNSNGQLYVINGGSGGGSVAWGDITGKPGWIGSSKPSYSWSEITSKPGWIGTNKPSYSWSEITGKPNVITSISVRKSGSGNAVGSLSVSGSTIYYNMTTISGGGGSWDGGDVYNDINIRYPGQRVRFYLSNNDTRVLLGNTDGIQYWVNGSLKAVMTTSGGWSQQSDIRLKNIVGEYSGMLDIIDKINVYRYTFIEGDGKLNIGVIAQEILPFIPEVVSSSQYKEYSDEKRYSVDYATLGAVVAIQGVKELYTRFLPVENKVKILESRVQNLQLRLDNAYREIFELKQQMGGAA